MSAVVSIGPSISKPIEICRFAMRNPSGISLPWMRYDILSLPQVGKWRRHRFNISERVSGADKGSGVGDLNGVKTAKRSAKRPKSVAAGLEPQSANESAATRRRSDRRWPKTALTMPTSPLTDED